MRGLAHRLLQPYNPRMERDLKTCLGEHLRVMLEAIAEGWRIPLADERTDELIALLHDEMTKPGAATALLNRLSDAEREALGYVVALGEVKGHDMLRRYGGIRHLGAGRLEWENAWRAPVSTTERLFFLGLVFRGYSADESYHGQVFFVPPDLRAALPPLPVTLPRFECHPAPTPESVWDADDTFCEDVLAILVHLRKHEVRARKGILAAHEMRTLASRLTGMQNRQRLALLQHMCERTGMIVREEGVWKPTAVAADWLRRTPTGRRQWLFEAWAADPTVNELCQVPSINCEQTGWRNDPVLARRTVLHYLAQCPVGQWLTLSSFVGSLHEVAPDLQRPDGDYDSWFIRDAKTGQYLSGFENWERVEGAYIRYLLVGPLVWLGIVAVGRSEQAAAADVFALRPEESIALKSDLEEEPSLLPLTVQPDHTVLAQEPADWYDRFLLERFARWVGRKDGTAHYRITRDSVREGVVRELTASQITAFLRRASAGRAPAAVLRAVQRWADEAISP